MISQDQNQTSLIEETVNAFDSGISNIEPQDGLAFIDRWLDRLDEAGTDATNELADTLEELRAELDTETIEGDPDPTAVTDILQDLIDQTQKIMKAAEASAEQTELSQLVATLENLHRQVAATITES
ncbi:hypothetical protein [Spirosoma sp. KUDC1026]|uniref:hypothetical protein n=1 Tax=Spirosoma sp. KUDC1026 TaxID=2745947 RepID=UPI00159BD023|nr:hypothetical protein [Spirosoma sp. KUDC1026]QKZ12781.1 hypothetical protein HU175_09110 [Spirosoma sp. KUDC1026]